MGSGGSKDANDADKAEVAEKAKQKGGNPMRLGEVRRCDVSILCD